MAFRIPPKISDVNEERGTIKINAPGVVLFWEDRNVTINLSKIKEGRLINPTTENMSLLIFPNEFIRNKDYNYKLWTPTQSISVENEIDRKSKDPNDSWGTQLLGVKFSDPLNDATPLINLKMAFTVTIDCDFDYLWYPMDNQTCGLRFLSFPIKPLNLFLKDLTGACNLLSDVGYERNGFQVSLACINQTDGQVGIDFYLKRNINKYVCQYYLPSAIIVIVSQTSFFIPLTAIPGRIGLVVTQFLALTNIFINEQVKFI